MTLSQNGGQYPNQHMILTHNGLADLGEDLLGIIRNNELLILHNIRSSSWFSYFHYSRCTTYFQGLI